MKVFDHKFFHEQGFDIVPNLLLPGECEELIGEAREFSSFKDGMFTPVMNPHKFSSRCFQALRHPEILKIMHQLFVGDVSGLQSQFFFCRPGTPGFTRHQDNYYVQAKRSCFASAWIALEDVTPQNGGLYVFPGSHKEPILPIEHLVCDSNFGQDPNAISRQTIVPTYYTSHSLVASQGDCVVLHGHVVHGSHNNVSQKFRPALLLTYIKKGERFRKGFSAQREEIDLYDQVSISD